MILKNLAASTTTTNAIVKIKIRIGTPLMNSIYVREIVLKNVLFEILPIPKSKPKTIAIKKETIVAPKVIFIPGMINLKALRYSSPVMIV